MQILVHFASILQWCLKTYWRHKDLKTHWHCDMDVLLVRIMLSKLLLRIGFFACSCQIMNSRSRIKYNFSPVTHFLAMTLVSRGYQIMNPGQEIHSIEDTHHKEVLPHSLGVCSNPWSSVSLFMYYDPSIIFSFVLLDLPIEPVLTLSISGLWTLFPVKTSSPWNPQPSPESRVLKINEFISTPY